MAGKLIKNVPYIDQTIDWPTGCESVSTVMLLQYLGFSVDMEEFVEDYLVKDTFEMVDGKLYGPDPRLKFAGSPQDPNSMGCYAPVIVHALSAFLDEKYKNQGNGMTPHYFPVDLTGKPMQEILEEYIHKDMPVIFWASIDLQETIPGPDWILKDTGEVFSWISNEHCMLLVGYDEKKYYFQDPWHNHGCIGYDRALVEKRHAEQYSMAVSLQVAAEV